MENLDVSHGWKYAIAGANGSYESEGIYEAAELEGRRQVEVGLE